MPTKACGYAAHSVGAKLVPFDFERRDLRPNDVCIKILWTGVCHSDLHSVQNDWGGAKYPLVPGHEIAGEVTSVGPQVTKTKVGDSVVVGCMVDSCMSCKQCRRGEEQLCVEGSTLTYNGIDRQDGTVTFGGYSDHIIVRQEFCVTVPKGLDLSRVPPLLCAGITTWSPLRKWGAGPGKSVAVTGLGGLGHMAVKLASALGAEVTVISRSENKRETALEMGADHFAVPGSEGYEDLAGTFDIIIDTIPVKHQPTDYLGLLDADGVIVVVGHIGSVDGFNNSSTLFKRHIITGSIIGGIEESQELVDFCGRKNVLPICEFIKMDEINEAYERLEKGDVHYRFVIDMSSLKKN